MPEPSPPADSQPANGDDDKTRFTVWPQPPYTQKADGRPRRVGVELELQGLAVDRLADIVAAAIGGTAHRVNDAEYRVDGSRFGVFRAELDYALLKEMAGNGRAEDGSVAGSLETAALELLKTASALVVPCEVVAPPLPMDGLAEPMQRLTEALREAGAKGTRHSPLYAFGVHLNVEPPDLDAGTLTAYLKAFTCLFDWIVRHGEVDLTRRATPYIQRFPADYEMLVADPDYWPDRDRLIVDYLRHNRSRNRALDMLPLLASINPAAVELAVDDDRVNARPAFHYRLANSLIDEPGWSVADPWSRWLQIEYLAGGRDALDDCCAAYRDCRKRMLHRFDDTWCDTVTQWLTSN